MTARRNMVLALMGAFLLKVSAYPQMTPPNPSPPAKAPATATTTAPPSAPMAKTAPPPVTAAAAAPPPMGKAAPPPADAAAGAQAPMAKAPTTPMTPNGTQAPAGKTPTPPGTVAPPQPPAMAKAPAMAQAPPMAKAPATPMAVAPATPMANPPAPPMANPPAPPMANPPAPPMANPPAPPMANPPAPPMANVAPPGPMGMPPLPQGVFELQARARVVSPKGEGVTGFFEFFNTQPGDNQVGVRFSVTGLDQVPMPAPAKYHIHTNPIPPNGDCLGALDHLSPNNIPDSLQCNPLTPDLCQEGDLGGKHGLLPPLPVVRSRYVDNFLRFSPEAASILGRSVVIHGPNGARVSCGNITSILDGTADFNGNPTGKASTRTINYPKAAPK